MNVFFLFAAVISIGAMTVSAFLVWTAIAGLNSKLKFNRADGIMTYSAGAPIVRCHTQKFPIKNITHLRVDKHRWSDGWPSFSFLAQMADGNTFKCGSSWSKKEIDDIVQRVAVFLGMSTQI